jgi:hypothetical protein
LIVLLAAVPLVRAQERPFLKDGFKGSFVIGTALNRAQICALF